MSYIVKSGYCTIEGVGRVYVSVRSNSKSVIAKWKGGEIHVSAPLNIEYERLVEIIKGFAPKLNTIKPDTPYHIGQKWDFSDFRVEIAEQSHKPDYIMANRLEEHSWLISVGCGTDISSKNVTHIISKYLCRIAQHEAVGVLLERGKAIASELGVSPSGWRLSSGHRILGTCNGQGIVHLSYALMFYPRHLRDYVICHELAHLSEMNHSARFHEVCNRYCGGNEKQLEAQLRACKPPII